MLLRRGTLFFNQTLHLMSLEVTQKARSPYALDKEHLPLREKKKSASGQIQAVTLKIFFTAGEAKHSNGYLGYTEAPPPLKFLTVRQTICKIHVHASVLLTGLYEQLRFCHLALYFHIFLPVTHERIAGSPVKTRFCVMNRHQFCGISEN